MKLVHRWLMVVAPVVGVVGFLTAWQVVIRVLNVALFPAPWDVLRHVAGSAGYYWRNGRRTAWNASLGFVVAMVIGIGIGAAMAQWRFVARAVQPLTVLVQVTPIVTYAPLMVIWLGFGVAPVVFLASVVCVVPFMVNASVGFRAVDPTLLELARSVDASQLEVLWRLRVPSALPHLFTAARISVGLALVGAVLGEYFTQAQTGLGRSVYQGVEFLLPLQMWGPVFVLAAMGSIATGAISLLERVVVHWHPTS